MKEAGRRDRELLSILEEAKLGYLPDREGGWDTRKDWKDVLSGGEKQRMALARLLYHEPRYAFIDEGTSAVSSDVEGLLYEGAKAKGITLITISTRASLRRYHNYCLNLGVEPDADTPGAATSPFVGEGYSYTLQRIGTEMEKQSVERELLELRRRLGLVEAWKRRRDEIEDELRRVVVQGGEILPPPVYVEKEEVRVVEDGDESEKAVEELKVEKVLEGNQETK